MNALRRGRVLPVLLVVLLLATLAAAFLFYRLARFDDGPSALVGGAPAVTDADRSEVLAVTEQFALRMDQMDSGKADDYKEKVGELLTTKGKEKFDKEFDAIQQLGVGTQTKSTGRVLASAVSEMDRDSATTLVVHDSVVTTSKGSTGRHFRWQVELRLVDGSWLVDGFAQVE